MITKEIGTERQPTIILSDIGRDPDDMAALVLGSFMTRHSLVEIKGVVSTLTPVLKRANLARYTLDSVGLSEVPVALGSDLPALKAADIHPYEFRGLPNNRTTYPKAGEFFKRTLISSSDHSLNVLVIAAFSNLTDYLKASPNNQSLFQSKVRNVVIMGGVNTGNDQIKQNAKGYLLPDSSANYQFDHDAAEFAFDYFQTAKIPMTLVSRHAVYAAQLPRNVLDSLAATKHPIGEWLRNMNVEAFDSLWKRANLPTDNPSRALPPRCDRQWFIDTFCNGQPIPNDQSVWKNIQRISLYDPLTLIANSPALSQEFFDPEQIKVNGVKHSVIGVSSKKNGVKNPEALKDFMSNALIQGLVTSQK